MTDIRKRVGKKGATYQVRYPDKTSKSGYSYATFNTMKEARHFRENSEARNSIMKRSDVGLTIEEGTRRWLEACEREGRDGRDPVTAYTLKTYEYRAKIIKAYPWTKTLPEMSAPDVVEFRSWLLRNHSRDQARKVLSYFHSMVLEMVSRGLLTYDIAAGVKITTASRYEEPVRIPSEADIYALLSAADRLANARNKQMAQAWERYRPMLYLAVDSGMRPQEYLVLGRSSITNKGVTVERALDAGGSEISVTKTSAGRRFIDLSAATLDMVTHYADNFAVANKFDLVFPTSNGRWQSSNNWRRRGFQTACFEAGLVDVVEMDGEEVEISRYKPYDLRHFYASMLIEQRVNLKRIQRLMGHSDIQTTLNVYGHVVERVESQADQHSGLLASLEQNSCGNSVASPN